MVIPRATISRSKVLIAAVALGILLGLAQPVGAATVQPSGLDHFLCYDATVPPGVPGFNRPASVRLVNQFTPNGFRATVNRVPNLHCNPVEKTITTPTGPVVTPITRPASHLLCFPITPGSPQPARKVHVRNQFGAADLVVGQPGDLCLPTWKNRSNPPAIQPSGVDHFVCYSVDPAGTGGGFTPPGPVTLKDQFGQVPVQVGQPRVLCLATTKGVGGVQYPPKHPRAHLLCFDIQSPTFQTQVVDSNQFGSSTVSIGSRRFLCLPSFKKVLT